jgi:hypothetical protein
MGLSFNDLKANGFFALRAHCKRGRLRSSHTVWKNEKNGFTYLICTIAVGLLLAATMPSAFAQSQALNGQIEGTVLEETTRLSERANYCNKHRNRCVQNRYHRSGRRLSLSAFVLGFVFIFRP